MQFCLTVVLLSKMNASLAHRQVILSRLAQTVEGIIPSKHRSSRCQHNKYSSQDKYTHATFRQFLQVMVKLCLESSRTIATNIEKRVIVPVLAGPKEGPLRGNYGGR